MYAVVKRKVSTSLPKKERDLRERGDKVTEKRWSEWRKNEGEKHRMKNKRKIERERVSE